MKQTWRWFGPQDHVSVDTMLQAGVEGVVSALHHIPTGAVWSLEEIAQRQQQIATRPCGAPSGLAWDVVESLPVSEDIKRQTGNWREHIAAWTHSIFAAFDIHILGRDGAAHDYPEDVVASAAEAFAKMAQTDIEALVRTVVFGLPGAAENFSLADLHYHLDAYAGLGADKLRGHLVDFLAEVAPLAQELGIRLCCHPDDPPTPLLGLPRIMSTEADYAAVLDAVDLMSNGVTLCSGSLGARPDNDLTGMMERLGDRVHFLHLRNVQRESPHVQTSFHEAAHLEGGTDMVALIAAVLRQEAKRRASGRADASIPFRPDHGQDILDDLGRNAQPGYPAIGRLKGLAELRGIVTALSHEHVAGAL